MSPPPLAQVPLADLPRGETPLRILFFCRSKRRTRVPVHFVRGFRSDGHRVLWVNSRKILAALGRRAGSVYMDWRRRLFRPDLVFVFSNDVPPEVLERVPASIPRAIFYEDAPPRIDPRVIELGQRATHLFTTARGLLPEFREWGVPEVHFLHGGCDLEDHRAVEGDPAFRSEVAFIGGGQGEERRDLLRALDARFDLAVYGKGWREALGRPAAREEVFPREYRKICASSRIVVGIDCRSDLDLYFSNRTWFTLGCGGFLLTRYVPRLEELFGNHEHLVWYHDPQECLELAAHYLEHEDERRRIAACGSAYVRDYHTFQHATRQILARVAGKPWPPVS